MTDLDDSIFWQRECHRYRALNKELVAVLEKLSKRGVFHGDGTIDFEFGDEIDAAIARAKL